MIAPLRNAHKRLVPALAIVLTAVVAAGALVVPTASHTTRSLDDFADGAGYAVCADLLLIRFLEPTGDEEPEAGSLANARSHSVAQHDDSVTSGRGKRLTLSSGRTLTLGDESTAFVRTTGSAGE